MFASKGATAAKILAKLILTAILVLENHGAKVVALVCDGAQSNRGLWKEFGIKAEVNEPVVCSFANPAVDEEDDRQIFMISDVPHLFKCARNRLLTSGTFEV